MYWFTHIYISKGLLISSRPSLVFLGRDCNMLFLKGFFIRKGRRPTTTLLIQLITHKECLILASCFNYQQHILWKYSFAHTLRWITITKERGRDYLTDQQISLSAKFYTFFSNVESFKNGNIDLIEYLQMSLTIITAGLFGITLLALSLNSFFKVFGSCVFFVVLKLDKWKNYLSIYLLILLVVVEFLSVPQGVAVKKQQQTEEAIG